MLRSVAVSVVAVVGLAAGASLGTTSAVAAPVTASGQVVQQGDAYRGSRVARFTTSVDPATGEWVSRVTFTAPQTADNAGDLIVSLKPVGQRLPTWSWTTHTDPAAAGGTAGWGQGVLPTSFNSTALPVPGASVAFEPGNTTLVLRIVSPELVGVEPDTAGMSLSRPQTDQELSVARAFLGPQAPKSVLPRAARRLTLQGQKLRVPLPALDRPADRRVAVLVGKQWLGVKTLPAKYYRRREAVVLLDAKDRARIAGHAGRIRLSLRTSIDNGSTTTDVVRATVR